ncbi:hypothetical protein CU002_0363 [Enterococcus faecium]|nr:hypothetical protein [Enterococcus faecium]
MYLFGNYVTMQARYFFRRKNDKSCNKRFKKIGENISSGWYKTRI